MKIDRSMDKNTYVKEISAESFHKTGLLLVINSILHIFGFAIVYDKDNNRIYPAICRFRGFDEKSINKSCSKIYNYLHDNLKELEDDLNE